MIMKKNMFYFLAFCFSFMKVGAQTCSVILSSGQGTDAQNVCAGHSISSIIYTVNSASYTIEGLPSGILHEYNDGSVNIYGSSNNAGLHTYTLTVHGACSPSISVTGTLLVSATLLTANDTQYVCRNIPIQPIKYKVASTTPFISGLPQGLSYTMNSDTLTISGTPAPGTGGTYSYYVDLYAGCWNSQPEVAGSIVVGVGLDDASSRLTAVCKDENIADINYIVVGGQAQVAGLPVGITATMETSELLKISGKSLSEGVYTYTINNAGGTCNHSTTQTGTIVLGAGFMDMGELKKICPGQDLSGANFHVVGGSYYINGLPDDFYDIDYYGEENEIEGQGDFRDGIYFSQHTIAGSTETMGTYNYTVTTDGSCAVQSTFLGVIIVKSMDVNILTTNSTSMSSCDAYLEAVADDVGLPPFSYLWNTMDVDKSIHNVCLGTYSVVVIADNGCEGTAKATIGSITEGDINNALSLKVYADAVSTKGVCDAKAVVKISGGTPPYSLTFGGNTYNNITTYMINDLCAGFYTANVSDAQLNSASFTFVVASPSYIHNNIDPIVLADSVFIDTLVANAVANCLINFDKIDSIKITDFKIINSNSINVTWSLYYQASFVSVYVTYNYSLPGLYTLILDIFCTNRESGAVRGVDDLVIDTRVLSLESFSSFKEIKIYPNPFRDLLFIDLMGESECTLTVSDITGKVIQTYFLNNKDINNISTISLDPGVYILSIVSKNGAWTQKIVKY